MEPALNTSAGRAASERWLWLDALKGIGILAVVAGHVLGRDPARALYLWHMPLFFITAGLVFKAGADEGRYAREKAARLLVPYAVFMVLLSGPDLMVAIRSAAAHDWLIFLASRIAGGKSVYGWLAPFWFVTCMFLAQLVLNACMNRFAPRTTDGIMAGMLVLAFVNQVLLPRAWLPWAANVVLCAAPLIHVGVRLRPHLQSRFAWVAWPVALTGLVLVWAHRIDAPDMKFARYGAPVLALACGVAVVVVLISLARRWLNSGVGAAVLARLGEASLLIMFLHMAIQQTLDDRLGIQDPLLRIAAGVGIPAMLYTVLVQRAVARRWLLGLPAPAQAPRARPEAASAVTPSGTA